MDQDLFSKLLGVLIIVLASTLLVLGYIETVDKAEKAGYATCELEHRE